MNPTAAANAYASIAREIGQSAQGASQSASATPGVAGTEDFGAMLRAAVDDVAEQASSADKVAAQAVTGDANIVDVVTAISETELAMETIVGLRDRVINAYESIMRMPI